MTRLRDVSSQLWTLQGCWEEIDRLRATIERLEIEKHDLAERLAVVEATLDGLW